MKKIILTTLFLTVPFAMTGLAQADCGKKHCPMHDKSGKDCGDCKSCKGKDCKGDTCSEHMGHMGMGEKDGPGHGSKHDTVKIYLDSATELKLSKEQVDKLTKIRDDRATQMKTLMDKKREAREKMHQEMMAEKPSQKKIDSSADDLGKLRAQMIKLQAKSTLDAKAVLTPEQKAKLKDAHSEADMDDDDDHEKAPAKEEKPAAKGKK
jgi:Spy/CpxP family protein refolding chaperone